MAQLSYEAVKAYKDTSYDNPEDMTSEEKIYSGFIDNKERPKLASFHKADSWQKKMSVKFSDERLKDFKARIILDAIYNGKTSLPEGDEELLRVHCAEALARPFAGAESRFMTIKKALEIGVTQDWADWAKEKFNYDIDPDFIKADTENQMSFAL